MKTFEFTRPPDAGAAIATMGIEVMIHAQVERFGVARQEEAQARHGHEDIQDFLERAEFPEMINDEGRRQTEAADDAVIDGPGGEEKVTGFALVGITTARTAVQWGKPVPDGTDLSGGEK